MFTIKDVNRGCNILLFNNKTTNSSDKIPLPDKTEDRGISGILKESEELVSSFLSLLGFNFGAAKTGGAIILPPPGVWD
jgi:hypothetical protein